jgi:hypothetical protein
VIFVVEKATPKQHATLSKKQWPLLKRTSRKAVMSGKDKAEKAQDLSAAAASS